MQMSTRSQQLHLTEFCEMNAFSEKVPFSCPELPVFKYKYSPKGKNRAPGTLLTKFECNTCHYINKS